MNKLEKNSIQFDYFSSNYEKFENDFYRYSNINIPLTFLTDDILNLMLKTKRNFFRLNAPNAIDKKDHYFIFKIKEQTDNTSVLSLEYVGHSYGR
ncbi:DUF5960 family protein [Helcococcus ovis]|uniref:DUF5960 family protein n=1 Tax=Helcococcus ovis TaxID=72026 RepID=UPI00106F297E|nr:DUF5960 family protein [Helcococcus ovis]TFF65043.1 hypothetical protein EQF92_03760 [Helcococcus ovis]